MEKIAKRRQISLNKYAFFHRGRWSPDCMMYLIISYLRYKTLLYCGDSQYRGVA